MSIHSNKERSVQNKSINDGQVNSGASEAEIFKFLFKDYFKNFKSSITSLYLKVITPLPSKKKSCLDCTTSNTNSYKPWASTYNFNFEPNKSYIQSLINFKSKPIHVSIKDQAMKERKEIDITLPKSNVIEIPTISKISLRHSNTNNKHFKFMDLNSYDFKAGSTIMRKDENNKSKALGNSLYPKVESNYQHMKVEKISDKLKEIDIKMNQFLKQPGS